MRGPGVSRTVSDDVKTDLFRNTVEPAFNRVLRPRASLAISKDVSFRVLGRQAIENGFGFWNEVDHTRLGLTLGLVGRKDDHVIENETGLNRAGFERTASGAVQEIEQVIERGSRVLANLFPLFVRVEHIPAFLLWLPHSRDRVAD